MEKIHPTSIKLVDGFKIRSTLDSDFAVFHPFSTSAALYAPKYYIPEGEWWLDERFRDEKDFFVRVEEFQFGTPWYIRREPQRRRYLQRHLIKRGKIPAFVLKTERRRGLHVMFVDGSIVREYLDPEFVFGGHDHVYSYIPKGQIWLDVVTHPKEIPFVFEHEYVERELMSHGMMYDSAHEYATIVDRESRRRLGVGAFPGDAKYAWKRLSNEQIAKKFYVKSNREQSATSAKERDPKLLAEHSRAALSAIDRPVWSRFIKNTLVILRKNIF